MGSSTSSSSGSSTQTQQTTFNKRTPQEQALLDQFSGLGQSQRDALLQRIQALTGGASPFSLGSADQATLNQAYNAAQQQLQLEGKDYADYLSGSRGMRMSDTPISQQALQRYGLGLSNLLSQKANQSLNMGMLGNQYRNSAALGLSGALPSGSVAAFNPMFQERLAGGTTTMTGNFNNTTTGTPSLMSRIGQGIGLAGSLGALGMGFMGGIPGLSGLSGSGLVQGGMGSMGAPAGGTIYSSPIGP